MPDFHNSQQHIDTSSSEIHKMYNSSFIEAIFNQVGGWNSYFFFINVRKIYDIQSNNFFKDKKDRSNKFSIKIFLWFFSVLFLFEWSNFVDQSWPEFLRTEVIVLCSNRLIKQYFFLCNTLWHMSMVAWDWCSFTNLWFIVREESTNFIFFNKRVELLQNHQSCVRKSTNGTVCVI